MMEDLMTTNTSSLSESDTQRDMNLNARLLKDVIAKVESIGYAQLFSRTTAAAIRHLFPDKVEMANFFELVNDALDIMNTRFTSGHFQTNPDLWKTCTSRSY